MFHLRKPLYPGGLVNIFIAGVSEPRIKLAFCSHRKLATVFNLDLYNL